MDGYPCNAVFTARNIKFRKQRQLLQVQSLVNFLALKSNGVRCSKSVNSMEAGTT